MKEIVIIVLTILVVTLMFSPRCTGVTTYDPSADINGDGKVNLQDLALLALSYGTTGTPTQKDAGSILDVYFSPDGGCEQAVIDWINRANVTVHVLIYSFTLTGIAQALINAKSRGVSVEAVFDVGQISKYSMYWSLQSAGVPIRNCTNHSGIMHDKVLIVDGHIILTGSFNWSSSAEEDNNENLMVLNSTTVGLEYENTFATIWNSGV